MSASAATDWANKRRAQVLRAEQLRAARKAGLTDSEFTGQPTVNKRPEYLDSAPRRQPYGDALDHLASQQQQQQPIYDPNDPMEAPLPGSRAQKQVAEPPDFAADSLGKEMKRFPQGVTNLPSHMRESAANSNSSRVLSSTRHINNDFNGASLGDIMSPAPKASEPAAPPAVASPGAFRSKFMQQYEQHTGQRYTPPGQAQQQQQQQQAKPAPPGPSPDELFMQTLRSATNPALAPDGASRSRRAAAASTGPSKPSWNDVDVSASPFANGFGEPPPIARRTPPSKAAAPARAGAARQAQAQGGREREREREREGGGSSQWDEQPVGGSHANTNANSNSAAQGARRRGSGSGSSALGLSAASSSAAMRGVAEQERLRPAGRGTTPSQLGRGMAPSDGGPSPSGVLSPRDRDERVGGERSLGQARSRLSLLKLKMRQSESGSGSRPSASSSSSSGGAEDGAPRTAPHAAARSADGDFSGYSLNGDRDRDRDRRRGQGPPPSFSRLQHQALLGEDEGGYSSNHLHAGRGGRAGAGGGRVGQGGRGQDEEEDEDEEERRARTENRAAIEQFQGRSRNAPTSSSSSSSSAAAAARRRQAESHAGSFDYDDERAGGAGAGAGGAGGGGGGGDYTYQLPDNQRGGYGRLTAHLDADVDYDQPSSSSASAYDRRAGAGAGAGTGAGAGGYSDRERQRLMEGSGRSSQPQHAGAERSRLMPEPTPPPQPIPTRQAQPSPYPDEEEEGEGDVGGEQKECPDCGRRFNPASFSKHVRICAKVFMQKRKVFDSKKMRVADNPELVKILKQAAVRERKGGKPSASASTSSLASAPSAPARSSAAASRFEPSNAFSSGAGAGAGAGGGGGGGGVAKWKQDSLAFRQAMRAARQVTQAIATGAPLPPPTYSAPDPSLIPCPHCGRRFSQKAGERHIPQCSSIMAKPKVLKAHSGKAAVSGAGSGQPRKGGVRF